MFRVLVLTHGPLGEVLLASAQTIAGETPNVSALTLDWGDTYEQAYEKVRARIDELENPEGVLILTDMYGGTPFNVARSLVEPGRVEIVTGVNLPMVLRLSCFNQDAPGLAEAAAWIQGKGQSAICQCTTAPRVGAEESGCD